MDSNGMRYFKKEIPSNPLMLPTGAPVPFEFVDPEGMGFIKTNDNFVIFELDRAVERRIGGVLQSTHEEYDEFQKKKAGTPLGPLSPKDREQVTAQTLNRFRFQSNPHAAAAVRAAAANAGVALPNTRTAQTFPTPERLEVPTVFPTLGTGVLS